LRLAILADIHANLQALEAVLLDVKQENIDQVIVNGDLVNRGPNNSAVIETLQNEDLLITLGNHDDLLCKWIDKSTDLPQEWFTSPFWKATDWAAKQVHNDGLIDGLRSLPMTHKIEQKDAPSLLVSHGSPRHYREGYTEKMLDDDLIAISTEFPADILVGSHTHSQLDRQFANKRVFNTGAVGSPFNKDPRAQYLILQLIDQNWEAEFKRIDYDKAAHSLFTPFFMWTEDQNIPQDWDTWERFKVLFPERCAAIDN